jgi:transketolase
MAVGLALAEHMLAARFNVDGHNVVDHRTWVIASDGDIQEGIASEASSFVTGGVFVIDGGYTVW